MGVYKYKVISSQGQRRTGTLNSPSKDVARNQLLKMKCKIVSLEEDKGDDGKFKLLGGRIQIDSKGNIDLRFSGAGHVTDKDLLVFTKQLQTMLSAGVPLNQGLDILSRQQPNKEFGETIAKIQKHIEEGGRFSEAMTRFPVTFDTLYCALVKAGEESGRISDILLKLVGYVESSSRIKSQIKSAMMYPVFVLTFSVIVIWGLLVFIVPKFATQFTSSGKPLPEITQVVLDMSNFLQVYYGHVFGVGIVMFAVFKKWSQTPAGKKFIHTYALKAPVVGDLIRKVAVGRFCSTMASMLGAGVNIIQALSICASSAGNVVIEQFILYAKSRVEQGELLSNPISKSTLFPQMVIGMMEVGEKSGQLDSMLVKVSQFYEEEVDSAIKGMLSLIEPVLIVFLGAVIAVLVLAMYLPIMDMGSTVE